MNPTMYDIFSKTTILNQMTYSMVKYKILKDLKLEIDLFWGPNAENFLFNVMYIIIAFQFTLIASKLLNCSCLCILAFVLLSKILIIWTIYDYYLLFHKNYFETVTHLIFRRFSLKKININKYLKEITYVFFTLITWRNKF